MDKTVFPDDYFWPHNKEKIYDHLDGLKRLWNSHLSDLELIKKWMALPITEALSMLMEANTLMTRMGNRIEYIKTTAVAFFFIGRLSEMQQQCVYLRNFIDETCNSLHYKQEEKEYRNFFSRDIPFKRPETPFDEIIPDEFNSDRLRYKPMSLDNYSSVIRIITNRVNDLYMSLERLTSYVLEAKEDIEMLTTDYCLKDDLDEFKRTNLYTNQLKELLDKIPFDFKNKGQDVCLQWLKQNELLRCYLETSHKINLEKDIRVINYDASNIIKRHNAIILKAITAGSAEWVNFLTYYALYEEIKNGLCLNEEKGGAIIDEIETSLHPKMQKEIYESYIRLHLEINETNQRKHEHFPLYINEEQGMCLYRFLIENYFIDATTDEASFLFLMGCTSKQPCELKKIIWIKNKQLLREMLEQLFIRLIKNRSLRIADLKKLTPICFNNQKGKPIRLANRKRNPSTDSDDLKFFFANYLRCPM